MSGVPGRLPATPLDAEAAAAALAGEDLAGWELVTDGDGSSLRRSYRFASFAAAIAYLGELAPACDAADHHPTWSNTYDRLEVLLSTHEAGNRVTARDLDLARTLEAAFRSR